MAFYLNLTRGHITRSRLICLVDNYWLITITSTLMCINMVTWQQRTKEQTLNVNSVNWQLQFFEMALVSKEKQIKRGHLIIKP